MSTGDGSGGSTTRTGVIDYGAGNLRSVLNALHAIGEPCRLVSEPAHTRGLGSLVFPGQGHFGDCAQQLRRTGLWDFVHNWVTDDRPFFGICLGYQLLFERSEESPDVPGLALLPGRVVRFPPAAETGLKVPHMGWNTARPTHPDEPLWEGVPADPYFYFVHSYFPDVANPSLAGCTTTYGREFTSGIIRGNLVATQFHPEKSQALGLRLLENFFARTRPTTGVTA